MNLTFIIAARGVCEGSYNGIHLRQVGLVGVQRRWGKVDKEWFSLRTARAFNLDGQEYT